MRCHYPFNCGNYRLYSDIFSRGKYGHDSAVGSKPIGSICRCTQFSGNLPYCDCSILLCRCVCSSSYLTLHAVLPVRRSFGFTGEPDACPRWVVVADQNSVVFQQHRCALFFIGNHCHLSFWVYFHQAGSLFTVKFAPEAPAEDGFLPYSLYINHI